MVLNRPELGQFLPGKLQKTAGSSLLKDRSLQFPIPLMYISMYPSTFRVTGMVQLKVVYNTKLAHHGFQFY